VTESRGHTLSTIFGIAAGVLVHVCWSLLGVGLLLNVPSVLTGVRNVSAVYLAVVGILMIRASRRPASRDSGFAGRSGYHSFALGFVTNAMNPKVLLFFIALFALVVAPTTPLRFRVAYGAWIILVTFAWFAFIHHAVSAPRVRRWVLARLPLFERLAGTVLIAVSVLTVVL
jgi:threonine/homoserine/homoserine lactone efflux protein